MSTSQSTADFILDQINLPSTAVRKMFGEYALYYQGKVVALICDNTLFVKITPPGAEFAHDYYEEGFPYPGAKPALKISPEQVEDSEWLTELIEITAQNLPTPKPKKKA